MSDQLQMFEDQNSQELMPSLSEALAKTSQLLETVKGWEEKDQALSLKQLGLSKNVDQIFLSGKMLKERSAQTIAKTLQQSCKRLPTLGAIDLNGNCLIQPGFYPGKIKYLQRQQGDTNTITARYAGCGSGSYIVKRKQYAQNKTRRLTPIECERLQGFPTNWTQYGTQGIISDTQRYKMCGNAVTVKVVEEVAKRIINIK